MRVSPGGAVVIGEVAREGIDTVGGDGSGWEWAEFEVGPQLTRRGSRLSLDFISNGHPGVNIQSPLIDIPVQDVSERPPRRRLTRQVAVTLLAGLVMVWLLSNPGMYGPPWPAWSSAALTILYTVFFLGSFSGLVSTLRWRQRTQA